MEERAGARWKSIEFQRATQKDLSSGSRRSVFSSRVARQNRLCPSLKWGEGGGGGRGGRTLVSGGANKKKKSRWNRRRWASVSLICKRKLRPGVRVRVVCMYVCMYNKRVQGRMLDYCAACTAGPRHPNVYTHVQCVDTSVDTDAGGARRGGGGGGVCSSENGSVRGTEPRVSARCGVVSREEEAEEEEESGEYEFHPNASIALCPSFSLLPSLSLSLPRFSHRPPPSSPSTLLPFLFPLSFSRVAIHPRALPPSVHPSRACPPPLLPLSPHLVSPRRGFIGSLIAASASLDRLTTYADAISKNPSKYASVHVW